MAQSIDQDWFRYREQVTVLDALEAHLCYAGVIAFVRRHGGEIAGPTEKYRRGENRSDVLQAARGDGSGDGSGSGDGYGYGSGDGSGDGYGYGYGYGYGDGDGSGSGEERA